MPRRHVYLILWIAIGSLLCYQRAAGRFAPQADRFVEVLDYVNRKYVTPVSPDELLSSALEGMVGKLDENSGYIPPVDYDELSEQLEQEFGGIGIQIEQGQETGELTVLSPLAGTPAYKAGVIAGDVITAIDDEPTADMTQDDAVLLLRGPEGEPVTITVRRTGEGDPLTFKLVREQIHVDTVLGDTHNSDGSWNFLLPGPEKIGYVRITSFGGDTADELERALASLRKQGMRGLVLDLRNDPGGMLDQAVEICDMFLREGQRIVSTRTRNEVLDEKWDSTGKGKYTDIPMVVLVNHFSASASEIVAACLQDHQRAIVVGERSYGKGSVQELVELDEREGAIRLTVASYWRPSGKNIHRGRDAKEEDDWGVHPNEGFAVPLTDEEAREVALARRDRDVIRAGDARPLADVEAVDRQLKAALDEMRKQLGGQ